MNESLMDVLHREHEDITFNINSISRASTDDLKTIEDLWMKVKQELIPHLVAEETAFYSVLKGITKSMNYAQQSHEQHRGIESDIYEVNSVSLDRDTATWMNKFNAFKNRVQQHVQFEESAVFDLADELLDQTQMQDTMVKYQQAEKDAMNSTIEGRYEAGFLV